MQKLVHHLMEGTGIPPSNPGPGLDASPTRQPTNPHWCKINLLTSRRRLVCPDKNACVRLRRPTEKSTRTPHCENLQTREVPEDRVVCGSSNPQLLSCMRHRFDAPSGLGDPLSDAWTFLWCLSFCLGELRSQTSDLRLEVWRNIQACRCRFLSQSGQPCSCAFHFSLHLFQLLQRSLQILLARLQPLLHRSNLSLNPCSDQKTLDRLLLWGTFVAECS